MSSTCIFCEGPCTCGPSKSKPARKAAPAKAKLTVVAPVASPFTSLEPVAELPTFTPAAAAFKPKRERKLFVAYEAPPVALAQSDEDAEFAASVRALESILHPDELLKHADILDMQPSIKERTVAWKREQEWRRSG